MADTQNLIEIYKVAAGRIKSGGDWFYKRTTFFSALLSLIFGGQAYLLRKMSETPCDMLQSARSTFLLIGVLSVVGILVSILAGRTISNSALWQDEFNRTLAKLEDAIIRAKSVEFGLFNRILLAGKEFDRHPFEYFKKTVVETVGCRHKIFIRGDVVMLYLDIEILATIFMVLMFAGSMFFTYAPELVPKIFCR